jgi:hypothetical protein
MSTRPNFLSTTFAMGSSDRIHVEGDAHTFDEGDEVPIVSIMFDVGGESLSVQLDEYHLVELRKAVQRAERWIKS